jgi:dTDP-4-amino-4,6-dideoxygalactose transaminase
MTDRLYVTKPYLPPLEEFIPFLERIWESHQLTNGGPFHVELEAALAEYLGVEHISLFANGTLALVTALQALRITGEVITTPFSFVATAHSLLWNSIRPVFSDIDPNTCNLDPARIESAITPQTTAILPVHCFGRPCDVDAIQRIADTYGLKVIYDAAHAFGVKYEGNSVLRYGDLSVLSFHATKVFTTFEGGAIICPDAKTKQRIDFLKNFGFADEITVVAPGINGKMNEVQAAFGLLQLKHVDWALAARKQVAQRYQKDLADVPGITCHFKSSSESTNHAYFPIFVGAGYPLDRDGLYDRLRANGIYARRYFHPLISDMPMYRSLASASAANLPGANQVVREVLCLPIYPELKPEDQDRVIDVVRGLAAQPRATR